MNFVSLMTTTLMPTTLMTVPGLIALVAGYLLGSIPFGLILTRLTGAGDLRAIGSGNIGATNVLRTGRRGLAATTLLLDVAKGAAAVLLGWFLGAWFLGDLALLCPGPGTSLSVAALGDGIGVDPTQPQLLGIAAAAGLGAFLGHLYPIWLKFKGGKGVATYIGVLAALHWPAALLFCGIWLVTALVTRISSLSALVATLGVPVYYLVYGVAGIGFIVVISLLIYWKHRDNIGRLFAGQESRIGAKPS